MVRRCCGIFALAALATTVSPAEPVYAFCSVLSHHPCVSTACSVFRHRPCMPHYDYWIGQDLRLTIESVPAANAPSEAAAKDPPSPDHKLNTLREMFAALRACWVPPADAIRPGMQMSVRFAFKRSGEMIAEPRVTYTSPDAPPEAREDFRHAIADALARCTPLPLSDGLGGAVAGRPIAIRFVDNRSVEGRTGEP